MRRSALLLATLALALAPWEGSPVNTMGVAVANAQTLKPQNVIDCNTRKANKAPPAGTEVLAPLRKGAFTAVPLDAVQLIDKSLRKAVVVQSVVARRTQTDTVEVVARLVNCTKAPLQLQARVSFLTEVQTPSEPTSAWREVFLEPKAFGVYSEKSMSVEAASYLIEVRRAD